MKIYLPWAAGLCIALFSCSTAPSTNDEADSVLADSTGIQYNNGSSSAAIENRSDTAHKFVRTADIKFKVEDVEKTTYQVEDIISNHGGFVTLTQLNSNAANTDRIAISKDSSAEITHYSVTNNMTFRIPNEMLDTTLKDIARLIGFLDYRIIKADDISLQLHSNQLAQKRAQQHAGRLMNAVDRGSKKLDDITNAEVTADQIQANRDEALLSNISLRDQVNFSTVQLALYQPAATKKVVVANEKEIVPYEPPFLQKLWQALGSGMNVIANILVGVVQIWPLLLLVAAGFFTYKKYMRKA